MKGLVNVEIPDRECPNAWEDCRDCEFALNVTCPKIKGERAELKKLADETEVKSIKQAHEDAKKIIARSSPQVLIHGPSDNLWKWWGKSSPVDPQNVTREVILPMGGPVAFGGGGNGRVKKSKKGNKPTVYVWGETL